jgi:hypothetical protein
VSDSDFYDTISVAHKIGEFLRAQAFYSEEKLSAMHDKKTSGDIP